MSATENLTILPNWTGIVIQKISLKDVFSLQKAFYLHSATN